MGEQPVLAKFFEAGGALERRQTEPVSPSSSSTAAPKAPDSEPRRATEVNIPYSDLVGNGTTSASDSLAAPKPAPAPAANDTATPTLKLMSNRERKALEASAAQGSLAAALTEDTATPTLNFVSNRVRSAFEASAAQGSLAGVLAEERKPGSTPVARIYANADIKAAEQGSLAAVLAEELKPGSTPVARIYANADIKTAAAPAPAKASSDDIADRISSSLDSALQTGLLQDSLGAKAPAVTTAASNPPCLYYPPIAGRGELIRLIAAAGGLHIEEKPPANNIDALSFGSPGQVPYLAHGDFKMAQSFAIETYVASIAPNFVLLSPAHRAVDDMFCRVKEDLLAGLARILMKGEKNEKAAEELTAACDKWLTVVEFSLPTDGFINGLSFPTPGDLAVLNIAKAYIPFGVAYKKADYDPCTKFPKFAALIGRIAEYPAVKVYLQKSSTMESDPYGFGSKV